MNNITINSKHQKQIDTANLSWCEMALLKKQDAFMYYSIPGNRDTREIQGKDLDLSDAKISACPGNRRRSILAVKKEGPTAKVASRRTSFTTLDDHKQQEVPKTKMLEPEESHPNIVKRKTAISFESYDNDLGDVMYEMSQEILESLVSCATSTVDSDIDTVRRGSVLQDLIFSSIALMNEEALLDSNDEFDD
jgi:hypothetical protein